MIFKEIRHGRPYPEHGFSMKDWAQIPPQQVPLANLITTTTVVDVARLLSDDPTLP
ncbi:MAG: type II toxin-antitoxin system VapB family antitoxin, partial [Pseudonocardiales bacterium]|nr:type II toxin-antitoxin system VapB family antitoxin [Pseudonocardiales bacterium]